jgi:HEAT repeat protein
MKNKNDWQRKTLSLAMIATGIFFLISQHVRGETSFVALGAEPNAARFARAAEISQATPTIENAKFETRALSGELSAELNRWAKSSSSPEWLGYSVPTLDGETIICCGGNGDWNGYRDCGPCHLEDDKHGANFTSGSHETKLEGPRSILVLYRAAEGKLGKIRVVSEGCKIDAGNLHFTLLTGVNPAKSVEYLRSLVTGQDLHDGRWERVPQGALTAIAMHADSAADEAMNSFVEPAQPESLRKQTVFWLGEARGASGFQTLKQLAKNEKSTEVRSQITFALSLNRDPAALDEMIRMAREDESTHVRGQALFWLAQKAGQKAASTITSAIENDPDTEVKKKAVFALSQMPREEGVPKLIQVAQNNKNPEVRKQAMFWLGQSNDPRALEFFEKILSR